MEASQRKDGTSNFSGTEMSRIMDLQKDYFESGRTKEYGFRMEQLRRLLDSIDKYNDQIFKALKQDP